MLQKDRKRSVDLYCLLGVQSVANVVRCGRLRWFGHLERSNVDDWASACRKVEVARLRGGIERLGKSDIKVHGLYPEWVIIRDVWRDFICANV